MRFKDQGYEFSVFPEPETVSTANLKWICVVGIRGFNWWPVSRFHIPAYLPLNE